MLPYFINKVEENKKESKEYNNYCLDYDLGSGKSYSVYNIGESIVYWNSNSDYGEECYEIKFENFKNTFPIKLKDSSLFPKAASELLNVNHKLVISIEKHCRNYSITKIIDGLVVVLQLTFDNCKMKTYKQNSKSCKIFVMGDGMNKIFELERNAGLYTDVVNELISIMTNNNNDKNKLKEAMSVFFYNDIEIINNINIVNKITGFNIRKLLTINNIECYRETYATLSYDDFYEDNNFIFVENNKIKKFNEEFEQEYYRQLCRNELYKKTVKQISGINYTKTIDKKIEYQDNKFSVVKIKEGDNNTIYSEYFIYYKDLWIKLKDGKQEQGNIINKIKNKLKLVKELTGIESVI